ncbi:phosphotransferase [Streptomyces montanisoli]|uniref:Phosphotransferase n=1 Tax=Streptomyces montanisoli TaxID=2798581 RepID=A0A940RWS3_9ACTN|nr:phosphotransferase [Streptomyces montanisoli]MBP0459775.1 phosphotransferase [Streptomyces montanisoli]
MGTGERAEPGRLLGAGRDADVYALGGDADDDGGWVLRRYRGGLDASGEAEVMAYLRRHGYPVPEVRPWRDDDAVADLVMRRLTGPTLAASLLAGETEPREAGVLLARLLRRLHAVPPRSGAGRILHLDLHPENVMLTRDGPMVIDWSNTEEGDPGLDRAMSALILAQVVVGDFGVPREAVPAVRAVLKGLLAHAPVSRETLAGALARRRANPTMTAVELARLDDAVALVWETRGPAG